MLLKFMLTPFGLAFDRFLVRWTGHSLLTRIFAKNAGFKPGPMLVLVTRGRKSGKARSVALPYFQIDGKMMVVGSKGGAPTDPFWVQNLRDDSEVLAYIMRKPHWMNARITEGEERDRYWRHLTSTITSYAQYEKMTQRQIPVVVLERR
jgi:F420H(2)-dependent quinone reductase